MSNSKLLKDIQERLSNKASLAPVTSWIREFRKGFLIIDLIASCGNSAVFFLFDHDSERELLELETKIMNCLDSQKLVDEIYKNDEFNGF